MSSFFCASLQRYSIKFVIYSCNICRRKVSEDIISKQSPDLRPRSIENLSHSRNNTGNLPQVRR